MTHLFPARFASVIGACRSAARLTVFLLVSGALLPALAQTSPAQLPLVNRGASVKPNIVFMFDNSFSMTFKCLYLPNVYASLAAEFPPLTMPGQGVDCLESGMRQNSPANNTLMYDPQKRYLPRIKDDGSAPAANSGASQVVTIYLPKSGVDVTQYTSKAELELASRYDKLEIKASKFSWNDGADTTLNPIAKSDARTDCIAAERCTIAEEGVNVANWRTFHSSRLASAQTGVGRAFYTQPDSFRLGWSKLITDATQTSTDGVTTVRDFGSAKGAFFKWMNAIEANNPIGTFLKHTLDQTGRYYERSDNKGPWAHTPWAPGNEAASDHLSCRRSYAILMTDGYWNDDRFPASVSGRDTDGLTGQRIDHATNPGVSYQYKPHDVADDRNRGKADNVSGAGNTGTLADVALHYWARDLRTLPNNASAGAPGDAPFWQNMTTYSISFGADGRLSATDLASAREGKRNWSVPTMLTDTALDDLIHAAHNGGGDYLSVRDADSFAEKLGNVIASIGGEESSEAGVAASATALVAGTRKFVPYYTPNLWWGNLKMVALDANGKEGVLKWQVVATDSNKRPTGSSTIPAFADRKLWVWADLARRAVPFNWPSVTSNGLVAKAGGNTGTLLANTAKQSLVDYLRGDRSNEGGARLYRKREALLGDIVNSTPVFIKNIANPHYEKLPLTVPGVTQYADYMKAKAERTEGVVFVGANDGMVHGFREGAADKGGGAEVFAYIPRAVLGALDNLADKNYQHQYYVDGPLVEADAYIPTPDATGTGVSTGWRNLVVGTTGAGAKAVFALNVTDPLAMTGNSVLWEANNSMAGFEELGHVLAPVQTGIMQDGTWVAVFGNGYYSKSKKASLFIVNLATGALVKRLEPATGSESAANGLGGVRLVFNATRQIMGAYAGDLKGRVWKFDLNSNMPAKWVVGLQGKALFTATEGGVPQPITAMPAVIERNDIEAYKPSYMVVAATGKLFDTDDLASTAVQAVYGLWDQNKFGEAGGTAVPAAKLVPLSVTSPRDGYYQVTSTRVVDWSTDRGWMLSYKLAAGQRTVYPVETLGSLVRIDTIIPPAVAAPACTSQSGRGFNFVISPLDGACKASPTLDVTGDGKINAADGNACGYATIADGADTVLSTSGLNDGTGQIVSIQSSGGDRLVRLDSGGGEPPLPPNKGKTSSRAWRQIYMRAQ